MLLSWASTRFDAWFGFKLIHPDQIDGLADTLMSVGITQLGFMAALVTILFNISDTAGFKQYFESRLRVYFLSSCVITTLTLGLSIAVGFLITADPSRFWDGWLVFSFSSCVWHFVWINLLILGIHLRVAAKRKTS